MPDEKLLTEMGLQRGTGQGWRDSSRRSLHPSSKGVRVLFHGANRSVIDGPFAETKELVAVFGSGK